LSGRAFPGSAGVVFGAPEGLGGLDLRDDTLGLEAALGGELLNLGAGLRLLLGE